MDASGGPDDVPTLATFAEAVAPQNTRHRAIKNLHALLSAADPRGSAEEREDMVVRLARWVGTPQKVPLDDLGYPLPHVQGRRLAILVRALERFPAFRERVSRLVQITLIEESALGLLARVGIPGDRGLLAETVDRLSRRLMPQPVDEEDLTHLLVRMFPKKTDTEWLAGLHPNLLGRFVRIVRAPEEVDFDEESSRELAIGAPPSVRDRISAPPTRSFFAFAPLRAGVLDAILLLASRVSSAGLSDEIRARSPACPLRQSPFFHLPRAIDAFLAAPRNHREGAEERAEECRSLSKDCRTAWAAVLDRLETQGVSVDVVYRLELIDRCLRRIERLLDVLVAQSEEDRGHHAAKILAAALEARRKDLSLTDIVTTNTRLLARKIIERAGDTGEHYITTTRREYFGMLWSAGGGGLLTAVTVFVKVYCTNLHRPPLQEGLLHAANYGASFLLMQLLGFSLATKQSSMTAAALAGSIKSSGETGDLVTMIARVTRSQLAAAFGNVAIVIPAALICDLLWQNCYGSHYFTPEYAHHFVQSIQGNDPALWAYAGVTGVLLWASSLCAGWLENWAVYRRLPEAIAEHRIKRIVGERATKWASRVFAHNIAGVGGNISIGLLLGLTPVVCKFAGIPVDIRHITLSTGSLALSIDSLGGFSALGESDVQRGFLGILAIGAMNFGVSFVLALTVAMRAREVTWRRAMRMLLAVVVGFFAAPMRFFLPVEETAVDAPAKAH